ncbi:uracil-DNA glycosylase [Sphingomonas sp. ID1715]|uniref:uracil-DNA glycosylase family protein n=1 Tax=Sphingomonas sp. ID1715 TaxID=1656898 RepID=UPI001488F145|nr:uracil-DNA glycosylase family protein [Sphingomonas sp. ID1715]NNM76265.1 uracil-DNA glycosylase [Sphingomonas sp. ID1715]
MEGVAALPGRDALASLIAWWREAGVDTLVEDAPRDWLAPQQSRPLTGQMEPVASPSPATPASVSRPAAVQERSPLPSTLAELLAWMRDSADVPEARWGRTRILPSGDPQSGVMILTDMPEPGDAEAGRLLAGDVGDLFDKMLAAIGHSRETIWLAPIASIRSIGRVPDHAGERLIEIARHQIQLVAPKRLLIMGEVPNRALIGHDWQQRRGDYHRLNFGDVEVAAVPTFHPRMLHTRPAYKKAAWADLQLFVKAL